MGELGFCHYSDIFTAVSSQLLGDISSDFGIPIFLVRALHNKLFSYLFYSLRCYLLYLDFGQVFTFVSPFLLPFLIYAFIGKKWRRGIIFLTLIFPLLFIFFVKPLELGSKILLYMMYYIFIAIIGFSKLLLEVLRYFKK